MLPVMGYSYDNVSQPAGINYTLGLNTLGNLTYGYDLSGRRMGVGGSYARTGVPAAASAATYNVNNQLTNWKGATLAYDANGNLTSDGTNTYTWNARNQLVSISGSVNASFQYDAFGRRLSKTINGTTQFLYDGANPVQEISGTTASANLLTGGVDEFFQRTDSAGARSFLTDALGSTLALADSTGTLQTAYTFEPFGNTTVTGSSTTNSFAFTGRELDASSLYFYRARYYSPSLQRFLNEDPAGFRGGLNKYAYALNDPASFRDPMGLTTCDQACQDQIAILEGLFPGSTYNKTTNTMTVYQDFKTVEHTLQAAGYQEPPQVWFDNPFLYWDPFAHAGTEEFRHGTEGGGSFHFGEEYPYTPDYSDPFEHPEDLEGRKNQRRTILKHFHRDPHNPARDPLGHIFYDILNLPEVLNFADAY